MAQPRRSREQWRRLVQRYEASGERSADFARREGLNAKTFAWWRSELRREARGKTTTLTLVPVPSRTREPVIIELPSGTELRVPQGAEPNWVGRLVNALR